MPLERRDVVAAHEMTGCEEQRAVTKLPTRFFEMSLGLRADDTIDCQSALLLEGADRSIQLVIEDVCALGVAEQSQSIEARAEICDLRTAVTKAQGR